VPLYDYECLDCGEHFEALVLKSAATCPACQSQNLEQMISLFSVNSESIRQSNLAGAKRKNAKVQKDKAISEFEAERDHHH
jgi:putative FmdB family regulatory protein